MAKGDAPEVYSCAGCRFHIPGDCSARFVGEDGYLHFPVGDCWTQQEEIDDVKAGRTTG